ncbi:tryptophan 2,3-dioxygenase family protein [Flavobacteriales bacterium]|nr:tryptophan 2,3-dioxygenase family protein [Flavobacteriales bacterium]
MQKLIEEIVAKLESEGQNPKTHFEGMLHSKPMNYWDYIQTEPLLNLQTQRTNLPDELIFIMYHQINELLFKMILWEIEQVAFNKDLNATFFSSRLDRISRYFDLLSGSFKIMGDGMEVEQYMKFRNTLAPASGFQSAQYRMIEFGSTELINLIDFRFRDSINRNTPFKHAFDHLYWQAAGKNHQTGEKSTLINLFEDKYMDTFIRFMKDYNTKNLWSTFKNLPEKERKDLNLVNSMRHYDHTVNVLWVMEHFNAAGKYLDSGKKSAQATGGSDWKKYMHPQYQRRVFFPDLWTNQELKDWGKQNLENHKILTKLEGIKI